MNHFTMEIAFETGKEERKPCINIHDGWGVKRLPCRKFKIAAVTKMLETLWSTLSSKRAFEDIR